jgi:uncharacterized protein (DUF433 family)
MPTETKYEHIVVDAEGVPMISGTTLKVVELVLDQKAHGWSPDELHFQHPYLGMGQIHSALAYYWDHKSELDRDIQLRLDRVDRIQRDSPVSELQKRLSGKTPT